MSKLLISIGHGKSKKGYDSGAKGNGVTEAGFLRGNFLNSLKKYAKGKIDFYEQDMYGNREANTIKGYDDIVELHLDSSSNKDIKGGHVIIATGFNPDNLDKRLGEVVKRNFGLRGKMFDNRNDLLNLNTFKKRNISYRLVELCFITNKENMDYFKTNYDKVAREIIESILNTEIITATNTPKEKLFKPNDRVRLSKTAKRWLGSIDFGVESFKSEYTVVKYNASGTVYIRPVGMNWGGNVKESDIEHARNNDLQKDDVVVFRGENATNWVGGAKITSGMRKDKYSVRYREGNVLYVDSGTFRGLVYDWDMVKDK